MNEMYQADSVLVQTPDSVIGTSGASMARELKLKPGWLRDDLERASKRLAEWLARPITQAQIKRAREMQQK